MVNIFTAFLASSILFFSFFEVIVFNDEIFLVLCFIAFLFVSYSHFNNFFFSILLGRSEAFCSSLFSSLILHFDCLYKNFQESFFSNYIPKISSFGCFWWLLSVKFYEHNFFLNCYFAEFFFLAPNNLLMLHFRAETKILLFAQACRSQTILINIYQVFGQSFFGRNPFFAVFTLKGAAS